MRLSKLTCIGTAEIQIGLVFKILALLLSLFAGQKTFALSTDPTKPISEPEKSMHLTTLNSPLILQGVKISKEIKLAKINHQWLSIGDTVLDHTIQDIALHAVVLQKGQDNIQLLFNGANQG